MSKVPIKQAGFTILELMIATTVFSVVLLLCTYGIMHISRTFHKGLSSAATQEVTRSALDEIGQAIQFSGGPVMQIYNPATKIGVLCVNNQRYTYILDKQLISPQQNVMAVDNPASNCLGGLQDLATGTGFSGTPRELLSRRMRLTKLDIDDNYGGDTSLYKVTIKVIYGDDDLLDGTGGCIGNNFGGQFCASSELTTLVRKRVQ
ncbi:MAG: prepilin-type N-terminal cleavage/methylation domain-containing protein [Patescibacteria group bacterium]